MKKPFLRLITSKKPVGVINEDQSTGTKLSLAKVRRMLIRAVNKANQMDVDEPLLILPPLTSREDQNRK